MLANHHVVSAALGSNLDAFCSRHGVDLARCASDMHIDIREFQEFGTVVSAIQFAKLLDRLANDTGIEDFGLQYAAFYKLGNTGPFGLGMMNAPNFREALLFFVKFLPLVADHANFRINFGPDKTELNWRYSPLILERQQYVDFCIMISLRQFQLFAGENWLPSRVKLVRSGRAYPASSKLKFARQIEFNADENAMEFSSAWLSYVNNTADHRLHLSMKSVCESALLQHQQRLSFDLKVQDKILCGLQSGGFALDLVASQFNMSPRRLQRKLAQRGLTFETMTSDTRCEYSRSLLTETNLPIETISWKLGFSSPAAYSRASRKWHGESPAQFRMKAHPLPAA